MKKLDSDKYLYFTVNNTTFKRVGIKRSKENGKFDLVHLKNCDKGTYKYIAWEKLEKIINK